MHRIRRQILDIELPSEAGAGIWQQRISRVFKEQVLPQLDAAFSRLAPPDRFVRIDCLEIDAGLFNDVRWEARFTEECVKQITQKVAEAASKSSTTEPAQSETFAPEERMVEIFRYFLETGRLPWFAPKITLKEIGQVMRSIIRDYPGPFSSDFLPLFRQNRPALQRLFWQFELPFAETSLETVLKLTPGWLEQARQTIASLLGRPWSKEEKMAFLSTLIELLPETDKSQQPPQAVWLTQVFYQSQTPGGPLHTEGKPSGPGQPGDVPHGVPVPDSQKLVKPIRERPGQPDEASPQSPAKMRIGEAEQSSPNRPVKATEAPQPSPGRSATTQFSNPDVPISQDKKPPTLPGTSPAGASSSGTSRKENGMLIDHAGLALAAVYLPPFFEALNLTGGKVFTGLEQQYRGIHLLHFMATGEENPEEPSLVIPKILCGLPVDEPVPLEIMLRETEKNECTNLLKAMIHNWPALKSTSPDGLRQAFLQRAGLLSWSEGRMAWLLRPERQAQDLLLERLPWGYSVIKLPWMPAMVQVEW